MEFMQVLMKRKSIRTYLEKQISEDQLNQILLAGFAAPISQKDYNSIRITVVQDQTMLQKIKDSANFTSDPFYGAPTLIILSTTKAKVEHVEYFNVACMVENMLLAATNLELGSIYLTYFLTRIKQEDSIIKDLRIPLGYTPISAVGIGYLAGEENLTEHDNIEGRFYIDRIVDTKDIS